MKKFALTVILVFLAALIFSACSSMSSEVKLEGNESSGDTWACTAISPEGVVSLVSGKYSMALPFPGMGGNYKFKFKAIAEGEALVVFTNYFRGSPMGTVAYTALVDNNKKLTLKVFRYPDIVHAPNEVFDLVPLDTGIVSCLDGDDEKAIAELPEDLAQEILDLQAVFPGAWHYAQNHLYYTITNDRLMAFDERDENGFTIQIDKWQFVVNQGDNKDDYPSGFRISGKLAEKAGNWYIGPANSGVWELYLDNDKSKLIYGENVFKKVDAESLTLSPGFSYDVVDDQTVTITKYAGTAVALSIPDRIQGLPVTAIGGRAFFDHKTLTSITIPASVTSIGNSEFTYCGSLTSINVDALNTVYASVGGVLYDKDLKTIVRYPEGRAETTFLIPTSVTSIGRNAFAYSSLSSMTIPSSVTSIGINAFQECRSLTSITIPASVTVIGAGAFSRCSSLTGITIPSSVTSIGGSAFSESGLTSITLPSSITAIRSGTFLNCNKLTDVNIPSSVTSIEENAFNGCWGLTSITIPSSVKDIAGKAFQYCRNLSSVSLSRQTQIGKDAFPAEAKLNYRD